MLKPVFIAFTLAALGFPAFAQSHSSENGSYAQRMLNQSSAEAVKQFDKTYPKPPPPVIPPPSKEGNKKEGTPGAYKPLPAPTQPKDIMPPPSNNNVNNSPWANNASVPQPVAPPPNINVDSGKSSQGQNSSPQNIFMPSGSGTANNNSVAPNPYR